MSFLRGKPKVGLLKHFPPIHRSPGVWFPPKFKVGLLKRCIFSFSFWKVGICFFLLSRLNPKQLTQNVDMLRGEPRIWIYYVCGYTQTLGTPIANKWSWFCEILYPLQHGSNMFQRIVFAGIEGRSGRKRQCFEFDLRGVGSAVCFAVLIKWH